MSLITPLWSAFIERTFFYLAGYVQYPVFLNEKSKFKCADLVIEFRH